ncbi:MAG: CapA family protein [Acidimicrobiia bacterium]
MAVVVVACSRPGAELRAATTTTPTTTTRAPTTTTIATTTTAESTTTVPEKGWLVVQGVGDVNLDPSYIPALAERGYEWAWSGLDGLFLHDNLTVIALECSPSALGVAEPKAFTFQCPDGMPEMSTAGVDVTNLGNNHSQDFGKEAMLDGRQRLLDAGLNPVGTGADATEATGFARFEIEGWKVAVLGFGGVQPHDGWIATTDQPGMADGDTLETMIAAVTAADEWADWIVVAIHWGQELDLEPRPDDVERTRAMIEVGADVVFGHHAHRLQPFEIVGDRPVFWGLGNFVWPRITDAGAESAVGRVVISPGGDINGCLVPVEIESSGHPVLTVEPACDVGL